MVELPMQVIFDWPRNKPIAIKIKKNILKEMAHGMPIGRSTRIVVTDEIQARRDILVRMIESWFWDFNFFKFSKFWKKFARFWPLFFVWLWLSAVKFSKTINERKSVPIHYFGRISKQFWLFHAWLSKMESPTRYCREWYSTWFCTHPIHMLNSGIFTIFELRENFKIEFPGNSTRILICPESAWFTESFFNFLN